MSANARLAAGLALLAFGIVLPFGSVLVYETAWPPLLKSGVIGFLLLGAEIFAIPAIAIMGKENFARLAMAFRRCIGSLKPAGNIGPVRHAAGIVLLLIPVPVVYIMAYLPSWLPDNSPERLWVNLLTDGVFLVSLFVLGGDFWDKLRSLFVREARARFPARPGTAAEQLVAADTAEADTA